MAQNTTTKGQKCQNSPKTRPKRFPKHVIDMENNVAPILMLELDGGHGAREKVTRFVAGILWWLLDLDVLAEYENEGGWSKAQQIEKMNGATARATNGNPVYPVPICRRHGWEVNCRFSTCLWS